MIGEQFLALRVQGDPIAANNGVFFLHSDHLGSTSVTLDASGNVVARQLYDAWGNVRLRGDVKTDIGYTSQREEVGIHAMFYRARYYSPSLGRFLSADTLVPDGKNPQAFNRYAYALNSPLNYTDPSGHMVDDDTDGIGLGGLFQAYRYWNDRPDDLRMALKSFFEGHPDYDLNLAVDGKDGFRSGLREGDWSDAAFSQMWVGMERGGWNEASKYFAVVGVAGVMAEGDGPNADGLSGLLGGNKAASTCGTCGAVRPALARSSGSLRIDEDGASIYCATCLKNGETNAPDGNYWIKDFDDYEGEALSTNLGGPEYTGSSSNPGHFSVFKGGPTDKTSPLWERLNDFIRTNLIGGKPWKKG